MELKHHINWIKVQRTFINTQLEPNKERSERNTSTNLISKTTIITNWLHDDFDVFSPFVSLKMPCWNTETVNERERKEVSHCISRIMIQAYSLNTPYICSRTHTPTYKHDKKAQSNEQIAMMKWYLNTCTQTVFINLCEYSVIGLLISEREYIKRKRAIRYGVSRLPCPRQTKRNNNNCARTKCALRTFKYLLLFY